MKINGGWKILLGITGTIILGAIGSGVWERLLSPFLSYLSSSLTTAISSISKTYSDSIYTSAANLYSPNATESIGFVILLISFAWLFVMAIQSKKEHRFIGILHQALVLNYRGWFGIAHCGAIIIVVLLMMSRQATVEKIQSYSYQQMEIVRPFVGEQRYAQLRSDFFRMHTKEDFDRFLSTLYAAGKETNIEIVPFILK